MNGIFRFRNLLLVGGSLVILVYLLATDPGYFGVTTTFIAQLATPVIAVLFAHLARKALFDYMDLGVVFRKAKETATGSGLVFLGVCIVIMGLLGLFGSQVYAQDVRTFIPTQAKEHIPTLIAEQQRIWPDHPKPGPLDL